MEELSMTMKLSVHKLLIVKMLVVALLLAGTGISIRSCSPQQIPNYVSK